MSNFYSYMYGEKAAMDKAPKKKALTGGYFVFCRDRDGTLKRLIEAIGKHGNGGHSYDIVLEPDSKSEKEAFFWDGDGSDRIESIIAIPKGEGDDNALVRMCLQTLDSINMQAKEASRKEREGWDEPPPTEEEREQILNDIIHDSNLLLRGAKYEDNPHRELENIKAYCKNCLEGLQEGSPFHENYKDLKVIEVLEHIKKIAENGLEKGITFIS